MPKSFSALCFVFIVLCRYVSAQAPVIVYQSPQTYVKDHAIEPLLPANTGGAVPPGTYGEVTTLAGGGRLGAVDGNGRNALFAHPYGIAVGPEGNIYVIEPGNYLLRKVTPQGDVSTLAGGGPGTNGLNGVLPQDGQGQQAGFGGPFGITVLANGNMVITDPGGSHVGDNRIRMATPGGYVSTVAGTGSTSHIDGPGLMASFNTPWGIAAAYDGNIYIADENNYCIRKVDANFNVTTVAGSGNNLSVDGIGTAASFRDPLGVAVDRQGNIYVSEGLGNRIRKITPGNRVTTFAGDGTYAEDDGTGSAAHFQEPDFITIDKMGNLYVTDYDANVIRKITPAAVVTTIAGSGTIGSTDGIGRQASFHSPAGIASDGLGNLYVTEFDGNVVRKITLTGYTIDKALPAGLVFDNKTGIISGVPTALSPATVYTVTAYNGDGESTTQVTIEVDAPVSPPPVVSGIVANTFTPNGDGINDFWNIGDMANQPDVIVSIYNRYGARVFYSVGYAKPWDGKHNGSNVPAGTYYYIIDSKIAAKTLTGSVTIIR